MQTGQESVFWTYSGPDFGPERVAAKSFLPPRRIETLLFVVGTNEDLHIARFASKWRRDSRTGAHRAHNALNINWPCMIQET